MKIGFDVSQIHGNSGIERYSREIVSGLLRNFPNDEFILFTTFNGINKQRIIFDSFNNFTFRNILPNNLALGKFFEPLMYKYKNLMLKRNEKSVDKFLITNNFQVPNLKNSIITIHDIIPLLNNMKVPKSNITQFTKDFNIIVKIAKAVIVPSHYVKNNVLEFAPELDGKVFPIYEGASDEFRKLKKEESELSELNFENNSKFHLFIGRVEYRKNLINIIKAFEKFKNEFKSDIFLVLVLSGFPEEVQKFSLKYKDIGFIKILNGISNQNLIKLYNRAISFVFPSIEEGFGLPIIEAMKCGCPVITSNISCLPEISSDAALLVNPYDVNEITQAIFKFSTDENLRNEMINKGNIRNKLFSWDIAAQETMKILKNY